MVPLKWSGVNENGPPEMVWCKQNELHEMVWCRWRWYPWKSLIQMKMTHIKRFDEILFGVNNLMQMKMIPKKWFDDDDDELEFNDASTLLGH